MLAMFRVICLVLRIMETILGNYIGATIGIHSPIPY